MKVFSTAQVAQLDQYTVVNEPIDAIDLMERASRSIDVWIKQHYNTRYRIAIVAGPGNNGGDALAVARMLLEQRYRLDVFIPGEGKNFTSCFLKNLNRLERNCTVKKFQWTDDGHLPDFSDYDIIIDGLFGSGLTRPLNGYPAKLVKQINDSGKRIISIDIPSGLMGEDNRTNHSDAIVRADHTLTFEFPKLSFFFSESDPFVGQWEVLQIGLHPEGMQQIETPYSLTELSDVSAMIRPRTKFSHKGSYGHALLIAGGYGKMGAAVLAARGCLRSGPGLVTLHVPESGNHIVQTAVPDAMTSFDPDMEKITSIPDLSRFQSVGIGPGIGRNMATVSALEYLLLHINQPLVLDADALNCLSDNKSLMQKIPAGSVLTPHPLEFDRLAGQSSSCGYERLLKAQDMASALDVIIVLKGANTAIVFPDGRCCFNSTGNPGMATGGSGDVLTGIITGLMAQGYSGGDASILGVYLHGLAGDCALEKGAMESLIAGDLVESLPEAFRVLKNDPSFGKAKKKSQF